MTKTTLILNRWFQTFVSQIKMKAKKYQKELNFLAVALFLLAILFIVSFIVFLGSGDTSILQTLTVVVFGYWVIVVLFIYFTMKARPVNEKTEKLISEVNSIVREEFEKSNLNPVKKQKQNTSVKND